MEEAVTTAFLRLVHVTKQYAGHGGVQRVSLEIAFGECVVVRGASGSGKTTLLRLIAGLEQPDEGEIFLDGRRVAGAGRILVPARDRGVGFVFQDLALWPHLTVREHLDFVLAASGAAPAQRAERIDHAMGLCRIGPVFASRRPHELSGGEQQRVAIARALVGSPQLLLLDEPFASLDKELRVALGRELESLQRQLRVTTIHVTHQAEEAAAFADRTITLVEGSVRGDLVKGKS